MTDTSLKQVEVIRPLVDVRVILILYDVPQVVPDTTLTVFVVSDPLVVATLVLFSNVHAAVKLVGIASAFPSPVGSYTYELVEPGQIGDGPATAQGGVDAATTTDTMPVSEQLSVPIVRVAVTTKL